ERQERSGRGEFRRERRRDEAEASDAAGLPAFLTNPVRAPVAPLEAEDKTPAPAPLAQQEAANDEAEVARPRRRRRTRQEIEAANAEANADFVPAVVKTSAAE
ncbi:MAG TPA: hypothetical protein VGV34_08715, partial [Solirubrobacterales bacterium]|nr:hypothetical protein [Solirubrobacterales bacterium]